MESGLTHVSDEEPGILRRGRKRFRYVMQGTLDPVIDEETLARIKSLAIPPAWTDVWITTEPRGHLQATGRDAKGRKVYKYHPDFRAHRELVKFDQLVDFGLALGPLRQQVDEDLRRPGLPFERVVALVIALMEQTFVRIGNENYVKENRSFGLTTLRNRHARIEGCRVQLRFAGKAGQLQRIELSDRRLCRLVARCQDLPGQVLFQFEADDDQPHPVRSTDVNDYLRTVTGIDATAKTFRTWHASVLAAAGLAAIEVPEAKRARQTALKEVVEHVANKLGNTPTVCRNSYIHPAIVEAFQADELPKRWSDGPARPTKWLQTDERRLLHLLKN